jgi:hypothetical protein
LEKNDVVVKDIVSTCTNCNQCVVATLAEGKVMRCVLREPVDIEDLYTDCS